MPKTVMITTTIYLPRVLELYRHADADVTFIIAGDLKTPDKEVRQLCSELGNALYLSAEDQKKLGYASSDAIGWNCIMRRSVALLFALTLNPDIIITIDDDNIPVAPETYFVDFRRILSGPYSGLMACGNDDWFNVGDLFVPPVTHRGFPFHGLPHGYEMTYAVEARVGVVAGLWYGDPDVSAAERLIKSPQVLELSDLLRRGLIVDLYPGTYAPFNSQNTGYLAELAPALPVFPHVGRYDDIWTSYVAERIMREIDYHVFYGPPFTWQERNPQNTLTNLAAELDGMRYTPQFCRDLNAIKVGGGSVAEMVGRVYGELCKLDYLPDALKDFMRAWVTDLEAVL